MKKFIALFVVALLSVMAAADADAGRFGVKGGVNVTSLNLDDIESVGALGYSAGLTWQWDLPLGFSLQPELLYHVNATKFEQIESQLDQGSLRLPVNVQWGLRFADRNIRVFAQATPFVGYVLNANVRSTVSPELGFEIPSEYQGLYDQVVGVSETKNRLSYGAGVGAGIQLWALQITAQYVWDFGSISNVENASWDDFNDSNFSGCNITVALMFGGKRNR